VLIVATLAVVIAGPGSWSLDERLGTDLAGLGWGVVTLAGAALIAGLVLASRRPEAAEAPAAREEDEERRRAA